MNILIRGIKWKVVLYSADEFEANFENNDGAIAAPDIQTIFFREDYLQLHVIIHEIVHAHYHTGCTDAAMLTTAQLEEVFCELFANHGISIIKMSRLLLRELKKMSEDL